MCINELDGIVNEYNNTYHSTIKIKDPKFKVGDHIRISNYKNNFERGHALN